MKIYFEDGNLFKTNQLAFKYDYKVSAADGFSANQKMLDSIKECNPNAIIYTNSLVALDNEYCWDNQLKLPQLYIRAGEYMVYTRVDNLTTMELREWHNLLKMYIANEFGNL